MGPKDIPADDSANVPAQVGSVPLAGEGSLPPPASPEGQRRINLLPPATVQVPGAQAALTTQIGDASKWLIAAMGAVAAIVLAGIHLSDIASVHGSRLGIAIAMVAASLVAVIVAIWRASLVLMPSSITISALSQPRFDGLRSVLSADPVLNGIKFGELPEARRGARAEVDEQERVYEEDYRTNSPMKVYDQDLLLRKRENAAAVERTIETVEALARYYETRRRFKQALWALAAAAVVIFIAAPIFVVATGRATTSQSVRSCRYAAVASSLSRGKTDPPPCPVDGQLSIILFTPAGRQAYEREASALNGATCTISKEVNPIGVVSGEQPVSVVLLHVNGKRKGPCITSQKFILQENFGTPVKYTPTSP